jgi:hypothetical protein
MLYSSIFSTLFVFQLKKNVLINKKIIFTRIQLEEIKAPNVILSLQKEKKYYDSNISDNQTKAIKVLIDNKTYWVDKRDLVKI